MSRSPKRRSRWAPAPVLVDVSAGRSSSRLDELLGASLVGRCRDATAGFGVMHPFRSVGEVFGAVPPEPMPLTKSYSAPAGPCGARGAPDGGPLSVEALFFQADQALGGETGGGEPRHSWACRGCGSPDPRQVSKNDDSALVCNLCGVVDGQASIGLDRQKMCARADDGTDVADAPRKDLGDGTDRLVRMHDGRAEIETAADTRKRHLAAANGTCVSTQVLKRNQLGSAHSRVRTATLQAARDRGDVDGDLERKLRSVLHVVEATFDHMVLHTNVEATVRKDAIRVVTLATRHARVCSGSACQVPLAARSVRLLGVCAVQAALERLAASAEASRDGAHDMSPEALRLAADRVKQLQLSGTALNGSQRSTTVAAIGIALDWTPANADAVCAPCASRPRHAPPPPPPPPPPLLPPRLAPPGPAPPSPIALPAPQLLHLPPPGATADEDLAPDSPPALRMVYSVRDGILSAARVARAPEAVRRAALAAIQAPDVAGWIGHEAILPPDVIGIAVLSTVAASAVVANADAARAALVELRRTVCYQHSISPTTVAAAEERLAALVPAAAMHAHASPFDELVADGIF